MNETLLPQKQDINGLRDRLDAIIQLLEKIVEILRSGDEPTRIRRDG
jgi:acetolactate synthase small subunit